MAKINLKRHLIMESFTKNTLNVQTVETFDFDSQGPHTAYTVYMNDTGFPKVASGWTLQDAIDLFARLYQFDRKSLRIRRPFRPQRISGILR